MSKKMISVQIRSDESIMVDASDEACGRFLIHDKTGKEIPVKHNMKIEHPMLVNARVLGVAKNICSCGCGNHGTIDVLWLEFETNETKNSFVGSFTEWVKV